jgi:hypothetical protein
MKIKKSKVTFVINGLNECGLNDFHWELSELARKFPTSSFMFKKDGRVSSRYQNLPILDEPVSDEGVS